MSNPAFNENTWGKIRDVTSEGQLTISGTINRAGILIIIAMVGAAFGWNSQSPLVMWGSLIIGFILSLVIIFKPTTAPFLSQPYALIEGVLLGSISSVYSYQYPGIVSNALFGTMGCFVMMLALYRFRIIRVTEKFRSVMMVATGAIAITYLVSMVMGFFGSSMPMIHQASPMGIGFSVVVIGVAALNLLLDFNMIEQAQARRSPKFMEWYCAFGLLVTIVWLYLEILRLFSKLNRK